MKKMLALSALALLLAGLGTFAQAETFTATLARDWMLNLADYLIGETPLNDPEETGDLSRPGEYLLQYDFGTVLISGSPKPERGSILEVSMNTAKIADCLGHTVGMTIEDLEEPAVLAPLYPLSLVTMQQEGIGWLWVYAEDQVPYGVEYVSYEISGDQTEELLLTYMIEDGKITAIRTRQNEMTTEEAMANLESVGELDLAQRQAARAVKNEFPAFDASDVVLNGRKLLLEPVDSLGQSLGDPISTQNLPAGQGRLLLFDGAVIECNLEDATGVETIYGITVAKEGLTGPRGILLGMSTREVTALFRSDRIVTNAGGTLYQSETVDGLPKGTLVVYETGEETLVYGCSTESGAVWLEINFDEDRLTSWRLYSESAGRGTGQENAFILPSAGSDVEQTDAQPEDSSSQEEQGGEQLPQETSIPGFPEEPVQEVWEENG